MNNSFYKKLIEQPELLKECEGTILAVRKRKYLVERIIGCIRGWFNVIAPARRELDELHSELTTLAGKNWRRIHS